MSKVHQLATRLLEARIHFELASYRDDAVMFIASVPGKRIEIEVFADDSVEVEVFVSSGEIADEASLNQIIRQYSE